MESQQAQINGIDLIAHIGDIPDKQQNKLNNPDNPNSATYWSYFR
jgi:hypothetical protein